MKLLPSKHAALAAVVAVLAGAGLMALLPEHAAGQSKPATTSVRNPVVARGRYLVEIGHCNDCHTPHVVGPNGWGPDESRLLSGHPAGMEMPKPPQMAPDAPWNWAGATTLTAFAGPWGISYAHNLTPDKDYGLGAWTEPQFVRAMRTGKHLGIADGRPILPPMPWQEVQAMTDQDMHAVWVYLQSIPPIHNAVPESIPAPPPPGAGKH